MNAKTTSAKRRTIAKQAPDETGVAEFDSWARKLKLEDGRPLKVDELREERLARRGGRPVKRLRDRGEQEPRTERTRAVSGSGFKITVNPLKPGVPFVRGSLHDGASSQAPF